MRRAYFSRMDHTDTHVSGGVRALLRLEGLALLIAGLALYARFHGDWVLFLKLFLLPDLSFAAYLFGSRAGAFAYNAMHSTLGALALAAFGHATGEPLAVLVALVWLCHIGFDRALGYGLKYASAFGDTHLGRVGRALRQAQGEGS
jgi:hypothetical protein